jgi:hypothetical protein
MGRGKGDESIVKAYAEAYLADTPEGLNRA